MFPALNLCYQHNCNTGAHHAKHKQGHQGSHSETGPAARNRAMTDTNDVHGLVFALEARVGHLEGITDALDDLTEDAKPGYLS